MGYKIGNHLFGSGDADIGKFTDQLVLEGRAVVVGVAVRYDNVVLVFQSADVERRFTHYAGIE